MAEDRVLLFGRFRLDLTRRELYRDGERVPIRRPAREILCVLASAEGAFLAKEELMARVWPNRIVEESNLYVHVASLRKVLDSGSGGESCIITAARRGYRFVPRDGLRNNNAAALSVLGPAVAKKPRLAVLPFRNIFAGSDYADLTEGIVEEIITALSRVCWLSVISPTLTTPYRGPVTDVKHIGSTLAARYIVEGSVRKTGSRVRITYRLVETETGACLAADRFDGMLDDIFGLQDKVALGITGAIEPALQDAETTHSLKRPTAPLTAHDLYLRGYAMAIKAGVRFREALPLLEQAITQDPGYAPAPAWASVGHIRLVMDGRSDDVESDRQKGADYAWLALEAARDDPAVISNCALTLGYIGEDISATTALIDRALMLNPGHARSWHVSGMLRFFAGDLEVAIEHTETSLRLSPRSRVGWGNTWIGAAHFLSGRFDLAVRKLLIAIQDDPSFPDPYRFLSACYAHMNHLDKAGQVAARLRVITPTPMPDTRYMRNDGHREMLVAGLRQAG
jgi:TolB-like protein